jgi:hypothetical protein
MAHAPPPKEKEKKDSPQTDVDENLLRLLKG